MNRSIKSLLPNRDSEIDVTWLQSIERKQTDSINWTQKHQRDLYDGSISLYTQPSYRLISLIFAHQINIFLCKRQMRGNWPSGHVSLPVDFQRFPSSTLTSGQTIWQLITTWRHNLGLENARRHRKGVYYFYRQHRRPWGSFSTFYVGLLPDWCMAIRFLTTRGNGFFPLSLLLYLAHWAFPTKYVYRVKNFNWIQLMTVLMPQSFFKIIFMYGIMIYLHVLFWWNICSL